MGACEGSAGSGPRKGGTKAPQELVEIYEDAHRSNDIEALRRILWWEAAKPEWATHRTDLEDAILVIFSQMRLSRVVYKTAPRTPATKGCFADYVWANGRESGMIGPLYGKLVLVGQSKKGERVELDPSFIVMEPNNRYYIDVLDMVLFEAAAALKAGKKPSYTPFPITTEARVR